MKIIPLSIDRQLHIYNIALKHTDLEVLYESDSAELEHKLPIPLRNAQSAKDLIDSMEEHYSPALLTSILLECGKRIVDHWKEFAPRRLEEEKYSDIKELVDKYY